ncbi:DUF1292 domain-containing protein [Enterococcus sp. BWR-S5]|uniref:DUF1292 domain-containing protein n=1 Tax=Enterococcus sp. BWR-S5 TaxID=2787714 RepID=UPI001921892B|nr:DUF1292 domain-containing protein [Enterococcus sp. BWR-S5]MBL1226999.1 DUF1292 domain-containing protein [Enterococcus sp. BWR-S5]
MESNQYREVNEEIILIDIKGNEVLYEILLTIDRHEEFGKNYILVHPVESPKDEIELEAYSYVENKDGTKGSLQEIDTDAEWDMIEEVFIQFMDETE